MITPERLSNKGEQVRHRVDFWYLSISDSEKLEILPETIGQLECLQDLEVGGCPNLKEPEKFYDQGLSEAHELADVSG
ncbi:hypothetical protein R1flu_012770 [Riccia fluitans]|uniref:Uncharacterized protein n=1 Tax=Riccia fluitans TaxID=41844 RepID=A0ABD1ZCR6_9MARC